MGRPGPAAATGPISCNPTTFHAKLSYSADDLADTITFGNGVTTKYVYDLTTLRTDCGGAALETRSSLARRGGIEGRGAAAGARHHPRALAEDRQAAPRADPGLTD